MEIAIRLISDGPELTPSPIAGKVRVSDTILSLLRESGEAGLKPQAAIELAARRGIGLNRGSVYSLLNRMERAGTVVHEDAHYKLREFARHRERAAQELGEQGPRSRAHQENVPG
jgi:DNA-binding IclR family transcriptional regulator